MLIRTFAWSLGITTVGLVGALVLGGPGALFAVAILTVLEISLSFDNAVVNAQILERMSAFWQRIFLTVGIAIAVFGMRILFPLLIVGITASLNPFDAVDLALNDGARYGELLHEAQPQIGAFGGMFLLLLFLDFILAEREVTWLSWLERGLARLGRLDQLAVIVALVALVTAAQVLAEEPGTVMVAGVLGAVTYLAVNGLGELFEAEGTEEAEDAEGSDAATEVQPGADPGRPSRGRGVALTGKAAFFLFLYLEVLDASFSFDGVIGAFAISSNIFVIATGLGIGALYVRSLTVYLVRKGTLSDYVYLEHGAHWAIGALAVIMLVSIGHEVPEVVTGLIGVAFIGAALASSLQRNRREGGEHGHDAGTLVHSST